MGKKKIEELKKLPFEKALELLEETVAKMEAGNLPLEEMMKTFEEGRILAALCGEKLKSVEKKIEILKKQKENDAEWKSFSEEAQSRNAPDKAENNTKNPPQDNADTGRKAGELPF